LEQLNQENVTKNSFSRNWWSVFWVFPILLIWFFLVSIKLQFDPVHYQTIDGKYYQELADDVRFGRPMVLDGLQNNAGQSFSPYPPGYPILLAGAESIGQVLSVNLPGQVLVHGFLLLLLGVFWCRKLPVWPFVFFIFSDTMLELGCYTWSEFSFVVVLVFSAIFLSLLEIKPSTKFSLGIILCLCLLVSIRYSGVFMVFYLFYVCLINSKINASYSRIAGRSAITLILILLVAAALEILVYGQVTGGNRYPNKDTHLQLAFSLGRETLNQLLLFKDLTGSSLHSFQLGLAALGLILVLMLWTGRQKKEISLNNSQAFQSLFSKHLMGAGLFYLVFFIPVRWYFYFAEFYDLRLLGPGFSVFIFGFFFWISNRYSFRSFWLIASFIILSAFFTLPKKEIFTKYQERMWALPKPVFDR